MSRFYERLNYSFGNEDPLTELKALRIKPSDTVVCITASGDRPLNLMSCPLEKIYCVDLNPIQNHLLSLKMEAMKQLEFTDYLNFLGATSEPYPHPFIDSVLSELPSDAKTYWEKRKVTLENRILYQGALEKFCKNISHVLNLFCKKDIEELLNAKNLNVQIDLVKKLFNSKLIKFLAKCILNPLFTKKYFPDPGLYEYVDKNIHVADHLLKIIKTSLEIHLIKENPLLHLLFLGKVKESAFPPYLTEQGFNKIKPQLNKVEIFHGNMISFLENLPKNSVDCFSLSDISSYMSETEFNCLLKAMIQAGKSNARFCIRELMSNHKIDFSIKQHLNINNKLSDELKILDRCFFYHFLAGNINNTTTKNI